MAGEADIRAGRAYVELVVKNGLASGLSKAKEQLKGWSEGLKMLGASRGLTEIFDRFASLGTLSAGVGGIFTVASHAFADTAMKLNILSERSGIAAHSLSEISFVAELTGESLRGVEIAVRTLQERLTDARLGNEEARKSFAELGVSWHDLGQLAPEAQFEAIAAKIANLKDPAERAAAAMKMFGRAGEKLLPMIEDLESLRAEVRRTGLALTDEQVATGAKLGKAFHELIVFMDKFRGQIGAAVARELTTVVKGINDVIVVSAQWVRDNNDLVLSLGKAAVGLAATAGGITALGIALGGASKVVGILEIGARGVGAAISPFRATLGGALTLARTLGTIGLKSALAGKSIAQDLGGGAKFALQWILPLGKAGRSVFQTVADAAGRAGLAIYRGFAVRAANVATVFRTMGPQVLRSFRTLAAQAGASLRSIGVSAASAASSAAKSIASIGARIPASWKAAIGAQAAVMFRPIIGSARRAVAMLSALWRPLGSRLSGPVSLGAAKMLTAMQTTGRRVVAAWNRVGPALARGLVTSMQRGFLLILAAGRRTAGILAAGFARTVRGGIGAAGAGLGAGLAGLGGAAVAIAPLVGSFGKVLETAGSVIGAVASVGSAVAALASPFMLAAAAVGGGIFLWTKYSDAGKKAVATITGILKPLLDAFRETFSGIKDAISAGDFILAAKVAITGVRLAFMEGLSLLAKSVGGQFGETIGKLASQISGGDLTGAWSTAVKGMAAIWGEFCEGIITVFTQATRGVIDAWESTVKAITKTILSSPALAKFVTGIDTEEQQAKNEATRVGMLNSTRQKLAENEGAIAQAKANGGKMKDAEGREWTQQELEKYNAELKEIIAANLKPGDFAAEAQAIGGGIIHGQAEALRKRLDDLDRGAQEQNRNAGAAAGKAGEGGMSEMDAEIARLRGELDALRGEATRKAAAARQKQDDAAAKSRTGSELIPQKITGSFSAAALAAAGAGGGTVQDKILGETKKRREEAKAQANKLDRDMAAHFDRFIRAAVLGA